MSKNLSSILRFTNHEVNVEAPSEAEAEAEAELLFVWYRILSHQSLNSSDR